MNEIKMWTLVSNEVKIAENNDMFVVDEARVEENADNIDALVDCINDIGYVENPIVVTEGYEVLDGVVRLEACKRLGINTAYIVVRRPE